MAAVREICRSLWESDWEVLPESSRPGGMGRHGVFRWRGARTVFAGRTAFAPVGQICYKMSILSHCVESENT